MPPDRPDPAAPFDEIREGRSSLRLVRIRLALTLIAVAILPFAALAPFARTVLDDPRLAQVDRLTAQSGQMTRDVRLELEAVRTDLLAVADDPGIASALVTKPATDAIALAQKRLTGLVARPSGVIAAAAIIRADGVVRANAGSKATTFSDIALPEAGASPFRLVAAGSNGGEVLEVTVPILGPDGGTPIGSAVAVLPLGSVLGWLATTATTSTDRLSILDPSGREWAALGTASGTGSAPVPSSNPTTNPSTLATGTSELGIPGLPGWQLVGSASMAGTILPLPMLGTLALLLGLLVMFIVLMARQILAPAAALEERRAYFQDLYLSARQAALQDHLTGLGNHRAFQEALSRMVEQARRHGYRFALVLLDIDDFKRVNDTRGHAVGDELLVQVGDLIRATIRGSDAGFRIGGDEFALLLAEADAEGAAVTARRILGRGLEDRVTGRYRGAISFSAGVTACPSGAMSRVELTAQADAALYRGKRAGRTTVSVYDPSIDRGHLDEGMRAELSSSISAVIESGGLSAVYQPIVHLPTGRILGYEGLVRAHPNAGFQHTGALFDAAEIAGRVLDLDRAALDVVLDGAHAIPIQKLLSLNVSPRSFEAPEFSAATFLAILGRHGVAPERVILELTERDSIRDPDRLRGAIHTLQEAGVRIAADDVGAGNAGLRLLSQFRFDVVKIDLSLVQGTANQDQTLPVLKTLVDLARRWGALTIAEGVETPAHLHMIRHLEIDAGQGYLLGRPAVAIDTSDIDLEVLGGPGSSQFVRPATTQTRPVALSFEVTPAAAAPIPTAASVLAGHRPNSFGRG